MKLTAENFEASVKALASEEWREKTFRYFPDQSETNYFIGVKMGDLFMLARDFMDMPVDQIESLLESTIHEVRAGAVSIMDKCARRKKTGEGRRLELYELFTRRSDRMDSWDLVDLGAQYVVGRYLEDKSREPLYEMAQSDDPWRRRIAIVATLYFRYQRDLEDMIAISEILVHDRHPYVEKAVGWALRVVGDVDRDRLLAFLEIYATTMPRTALRNAIEHLEEPLRGRYLSMGK